MNLPNLKFSLILATVDRTDELAHFLIFLDKQAYRNFELIIVDQNEDDRLLPIIAPYRDRFTVLHVRSARGLSRARNVGLKHVTGDIVAFPDDDCHYPSELLSNVAALFMKNRTYDGITGIVIGENNNKLMPRFDKRDGHINCYNVWKRASSISIFLKADVIGTVGDFDELLGAGSGTPWGCAEEIDYLIRAVSSGKYLYYSPLIEVVHKRINDLAGSMHIVRTASFAPGTGYVLRKNNYSLWFVLWFILRSLIGAALALVSGEWHIYLVRLIRAKGIVSGWFGAYSLNCRTKKVVLKCPWKR